MGRQSKDTTMEDADENVVSLQEQYLLHKGWNSPLSERDQTVQASDIDRLTPEFRRMLDMFDAEEAAQTAVRRQAFARQLRHDQLRQEVDELEERSEQQRTRAAEIRSRSTSVVANSPSGVEKWLNTIAAELSGAIGVHSKTPLSLSQRMLTPSVQQDVSRDEHCQASHQGTKDEGSKSTRPQPAPVTPTRPRPCRAGECIICPDERGDPIPPGTPRKAQMKELASANPSVVARRPRTKNVSVNLFTPEDNRDKANVQYFTLSTFEKLANKLEERNIEEVGLPKIQLDRLPPRRQYLGSSPSQDSLPKRPRVSRVSRSQSRAKNTSKDGAEENAMRPDL